MKSLSDSNKPWAKYVMVVWAFFECLLFSGTLYGWSSLVFVLKEEGIYSTLCNDSSSYLDANNGENNNTFTTAIEIDAKNRSHEKGNNLNATDMYNGNVTDLAGCDAQDSMMSLCFTISSSLFCISSAVMGHINYKLGTRLTRYISFVLFTAGSICLAFVSEELPWLIFPGLALIGIGGLPLFVTNNQISNLFIKGSSSVVGLLCGSLDMSAAVFLIIKIAFHYGFSRKNMFGVLAGMQVLTLISTRMFLPEDYIEQNLLQECKQKEIKVNNEPEDALEMKQRAAVRERRRPSIADIQPLKSYLRQPLLLTHIIWFCLLTLRFYYFIGNLNTFLNRILDKDNERVSYFTNVCFYIMIGGLLTSFLVGIVYDGQKSCFKGGKTKLYRSLMPALLPLSLASMFGVIMSILALIPSPDTLYICFIAMVLCRSFMYSMDAAFILAIFPIRYFGVLYGVTMVSAGVFSLFNYALFSWAEAYQNAPLHVDLLLSCISVLSFLHPIYMWFCAWREEKNETK